MTGAESSAGSAADGPTADIGVDEQQPAPATDPWTAQMNALGGYIRAQRQLARLSLREMANLTNISNAYLSQVERGLHQPSLKVLHSIAEALQLSAEQLLDRAGWTMDAGAAPRDDCQSAAGGHAHEFRSTSEDAARSAQPPDTETVIRSDPRLTDSQRKALIGVYRSFVGNPTG